MLRKNNSFRAGGYRSVGRVWKEGKKERGREGEREGGEGGGEREGKTNFSYVIQSQVKDKSYSSYTSQNHC